MLAITRDGTRVYVPSYAGAVSVIDTSSNAVIANIQVGVQPYGVAISTDGTRAYVTDSGNISSSNSLWVIDVPSNTVIANLSVGKQPTGVVVTPFLDSDSGLAQLTGGNSFTGNQTVNGDIVASLFFGDGSGLVNLNPAKLAPGTAAINISGTAASAVNTANLGGVAAGNYARLDLGNNFTGNQQVAGNLSTAGTTTLGGGTPIVEHLSTTFSPAFAALKPATCATQNYTLAGANDGDMLALGVPNERTTGGGTIIYFAWVSAANTLTIQACNIGASPQKLMKDIFPGTRCTPSVFRFKANHSSEALCTRILHPRLPRVTRISAYFGVAPRRVSSCKYRLFTP